MLDIVEGTKVERTKEPKTTEPNYIFALRRKILCHQRAALKALEQGDLNSLRDIRADLVATKISLLEREYYTAKTVLERHQAKSLI